MIECDTINIIFSIQQFQNQFDRKTGVCSWFHRAFSSRSIGISAGSQMYKVLQQSSIQYHFTAGINDSYDHAWKDAAFIMPLLLYHVFFFFNFLFFNSEQLQQHKTCSNFITSFGFSTIFIHIFCKMKLGIKSGKQKPT